MTLFKGKYRIESNRLPGWNYGSNALYFITICTKNRAHYFGKVINGEMQLSEYGSYADQCWHEIPEHFPFVILHAHVVMPNHVHGVIEICKPKIIDNGHAGGVDAQNFAHLPAHIPQPYKNKFGPQSKNLASIIRGYKIGVTVNSRKTQPLFSWQSNYHDHIIRNNKSYENIVAYIIDNPKKWEKDRFYKIE